jgi:tRNA A37 threonylcarbamoyltransferase TsaD
MPMDPQALKSKMKQTIYNGLKKEFNSSASQGDGYSSVADENWLKIASAVSEIAADIIMEITTNAQVLSGISSVGVGGGIPGPVQVTSVSPGKIQ